MEQSIVKSNQNITFCFLKGIALGTVLGIGMGSIGGGIFAGLCLAFLVGIISKRR